MLTSEGGTWNWNLVGVSVDRHDTVRRSRGLSVPPRSRGIANLPRPRLLCVSKIIGALLLPLAERIDLYSR